MMKMHFKQHTCKDMIKETWALCFRICMSSRILFPRMIKVLLTLTERITWPVESTAKGLFKRFNKQWRRIARSSDVVFFKYWWSANHFWSLCNILIEGDVTKCNNNNYNKCMENSFIWTLPWSLGKANRNSSPLSIDMIQETIFDFLFSLPCFEWTPGRKLHN